jgi:hypothetical protein
MYALFFDSDGIVTCVVVSERDNVTGTFSLETFARDHVFTAEVNNYITKNPRPGVRRIKLPHDYAHRSVLVLLAYLEEQRIEILLHPANSPDRSLIVTLG